MNIVLANESHIPGMIKLLKQVGQVHHDIRPDIFRDGAQKYDETALKKLLKDPSRPIFIAQEGETVLGYCFCIHKDYAGDPVLAVRMWPWWPNPCCTNGKNRPWPATVAAARCFSAAVR